MRMLPRCVGKSLPGRGRIIRPYNAGSIINIPFCSFVVAISDGSKFADKWLLMRSAQRKHRLLKCVRKRLFIIRKSHLRIILCLKIKRRSRKDNLHAGNLIGNKFDLIFYYEWIIPPTNSNNIKLLSSQRIFWCD